jgi:hypothetical protein
MLAGKRQFRNGIDRVRLRSQDLLTPAFFRRERKQEADTQLRRRPSGMFLSS